MQRATNFMTIEMFAKVWSEKEGLSESSIEVRIAITSSTLYGGMIGSERLTYDHWGACMYCYNWSTYC